MKASNVVFIIKFVEPSGGNTTADTSPQPPQPKPLLYKRLFARTKKQVTSGTCRSTPTSTPTLSLPSSHTTSHSKSPYTAHHLTLHIHLFAYNMKNSYSASTSTSSSDESESCPSSFTTHMLPILYSLIGLSSRMLVLQVRESFPNPGILKPFI